MAVAIDAIGTGLYLPLSMVYFLTVTDLSEAGVGLLLTTATACSLLLPLLVGRFVDRIGPRPVVMTGQLDRPLKGSAVDAVEVQNRELLRLRTRLSDGPPPGDGGRPSVLGLRQQ